MYSSDHDFAFAATKSFLTRWLKAILIPLFYLCYFGSQLGYNEDNKEWTIFSQDDCQCRQNGRDDSKWSLS
ncbi:transmembrane protein, putative [Medicago truncatula]|uniref:Transmembrane protein, putative n=1 Tax=Medicago truncatula TaxID=3880 RepID=G7KN63_MEDTR|nr:transmembrane protein, putative [Medicago truncatula]